MIDLENIYTYHSPKDTQPERYERIRYKAKMLAAFINEKCPDSREKSLDREVLIRDSLLCVKYITARQRTQVKPPCQFITAAHDPIVGISNSSRRPLGTVLVQAQAHQSGFARREQSVERYIGAKPQAPDRAVG